MVAMMVSSDSRMAVATSGESWTNPKVLAMVLLERWVSAMRMALACWLGGGA